MTEELLKEIAKGDEEAYNFMTKWLRHCHGIDDLIDNKETDPQLIINAFVNTQLLFGTDPFYNRFTPQLITTMLLAANAYADSVQYEQESFGWKTILGDTLRCYGNEVLFVVAILVGGWEHCRAISLKTRELSFKQHHDLEGNPC